MRYLRYVFYARSFSKWFQENYAQITREAENARSTSRKPRKNYAQIAREDKNARSDSRKPGENYAQITSEDENARSDSRKPGKTTHPGNKKSLPRTLERPDFMIITCLNSSSSGIGFEFPRIPAYRLELLL